MTTHTACSACRGEGTVTYEDDIDDRPWGGYSVRMVTATCMTCDGSRTVPACAECGEEAEECACAETKTAASVASADCRTAETTTHGTEAA